jgi:short-subunit dehydrogenase
MKNIFILSISSDIGEALAHFWLDQGYKVAGTYRTWSDSLASLEEKGAKLHFLDIGSSSSFENLMKTLPAGFSWDVLVISVGDQNPIGAFSKTKFSDWATSINVNFVGQMEFLHHMLPFCRQGKKVSPKCIFFAGGGTNGPVINYSAYTISKIASIKMVELLDAEIPEISFTILGPGWVKTKIHDATLASSEKIVGDNFLKTKEMLESNSCHPIERVVDCCNWVINASSAVVSGRNFSVVHDPWDTKAINEIANEPDVFKLRRHGNDFFEVG